MTSKSIIVLICSVAAVAGQRKPPAHPVILRSTQLEAVFDRDDALPFEYRLLNQKALIHGEDQGHKIKATIFTAQSHKFESVEPTLKSSEAAASHADFRFDAGRAGS